MPEFECKMNYLYKWLKLINVSKFGGVGSLYLHSDIRIILVPSLSPSCFTFLSHLQLVARCRHRQLPAAMRAIRQNGKGYFGHHHLTAENIYYSVWFGYVTMSTNMHTFGIPYITGAIDKSHFWHTICSHACKTWEKMATKMECTAQRMAIVFRHILHTRIYIRHHCRIFYQR